MPTQKELIATGRNEEDIAKIIGADALVYQDIESMQRSVSDLNPSLMHFDNSCFTGEYVTGDITPEYLESVGRNRSHAQDGANGLLFNMGYAAEDD
jgi:amidophosphoribosyltransferase